MNKIRHNKVILLFISIVFSSSFLSQAQTSILIEEDQLNAYKSSNLLNAAWTLEKSAYDVLDAQKGIDTVLLKIAIPTTKKQPFNGFVVARQYDKALLEDGLLKIYQDIPGDDKSLQNFTEIPKDKLQVAKKNLYGDFLPFQEFYRVTFLNEVYEYGWVNQNDGKIIAGLSAARINNILEKQKQLGLSNNKIKAILNQTFTNNDSFLLVYLVLGYPQQISVVDKNTVSWQYLQRNYKFKNGRLILNRN